jgi:predicted ArsR family transcriptional regulator
VTGARSRGRDRRPGGRRSTAGVDRRRQILSVLRAAAAPRSVLDLAARLDVHPNTVRFHLDALVETGQVERVESPPAGPGRPPLTFRARRRMDPTGPRRYRLLATILAAGLAAEPDATARAVEAGRAWGAQLPDPSAGGSGGAAAPPVERLVALLDELGFAPERRPAVGQTASIGLRHCPFLELAESRAGIVCAIHLGLMRGMMATMDAPVTVERLEPFVEPDLCLAHLKAAR